MGGPSLQVSTEPSVDLSENRRLVTVMFADLSGSTSLGEHLDPEDLRKVLSSFFGALAREIQRYGGTVDKYIGDAVMAVFGAPVAHEDDPERAISAAIAMQAAIGQLNEDLQRRYGRRLQLRIGINTGEVVAGLLAGDIQGAYTVVGDAVNTAQRFESVAEPGTILVGSSTRDLTRKAFDFEALPPVVLKGKAIPQQAYRVLSPRYESIDPGAVPLVGRDTELTVLETAFETARRGNGRFVHIVGDAGIGKSRLVRELRASIDPDVVQIVGRCVSFEVQRPYALLARLLRDILRVPSGKDETAARLGIERVLALVQPSSDSLDVTLLLEVLGYGESTALDPQSRQRVLVRLLRRLLAAYSEQSPLLIITEDLHWADPASMALLGEVARDIPTHRCLLLSTSRPGALPPWKSEVLTLEALPQSGARALVESGFGAPVDDDLAETILTRTSGNPFFIEEVVRGLREAGTIVERDGRIGAHPGTLPRVPTTVQEVLEARLDRLEPGPKRVLQVAAVCGRIFWQRVVERLAPEDAPPDSLSLLERESFILPHALVPEPTYAFRHALIQEVAYHRQLQTQRRVTHAAIAEALEIMYPQRLDELVDDLAFHYGRSDNDAKAVHWLVRAGDRARGLYANSEALSHYQAALTRAGDDGAVSASAILERVADVQTLIGRYDEAVETLRSAIQRIPVDHGPMVARLQRRLGTALLLKGAFAETATTLDAALAALPDRNDPEVARIELLVGQLHYRRGEFEQARIALEHAVELGSRFGIDDLVAESLKQLGNVAVERGELTVAADFYKRSRVMYERLENMVGLADTHNNLGIIYRRTGQLGEALAEYDASLALCQRMGHLLGIGRCYNNIAEVHRMRGDPARAIPAYLQAIDTWGSIGHALFVGLALIGLGAARVETGDIMNGRADLLDAEARFAALGSTIYLPDLYRYLASAELAAGDLEAADTAAARSLDYARAGTARHQEAATLRVMGEIALARGERDIASVLLQISKETLTKVGDAQELARTEAVLKRFDNAT